METSTWSPAGLAAAAGMAAASALHAAWATGSTFPADSPRELAGLVVGSEQQFPGRAPTAAVAVALAGAAGSVALQSLPGRVRPDIVDRWTRRAAGAAAGAMLARGVGGFAAESLRLVHPTERFRRWDLRLYSPLTLAFGLGSLAALKRGRAN